MDATLDLRPVVIGVDGWADSYRALRWAADEAARRGTWLSIMHAWQSPRYGTLGPPLPDDPHAAAHHDPIRAAVEQILADAESVAHRRCPGLVVKTSLFAGDSCEALVEASREAGLVVIGSRGLPGFTGFVLGSVGSRVVARAHCPVVIVRFVREHRGPVIVGFSGSPHAVTTLQAGARMAIERSAPLHVVHVDEASRRNPPSEAHSRQREAWLAAWVDDALREERDAGLAITTQVLCGDPRRQLLALSRSARLLVAGSHGHHALLGLVLGGLTSAISRESTCPVMVCPDAGPPTEAATLDTPAAIGAD